MATTQELLNHLSKQILRDRPSTVTGGVHTPLWSNETLVLYLNQAQNLFARRTYCLIDSSTADPLGVDPVPGAATQFDTVAGTAVYSLHASVLTVLSARLSTSTSDLSRVSHDELRPSYAPSLYPWPDLSTPPANQQPRMYSTQEGTKKIEFGPTPDAVYTIILRVARLPLSPLSTSDLTASPEIPEEYHLDLCDWAAYLALSEPEVDGNAADRAAEYRGRFMDALRMARQDLHRSESAPLRHFFGGW